MFETPLQNTTEVLDTLNQILEVELAGVIRYTHYSFMVYGYSRIPIVSWLREEAASSLVHAHEAGELITQLGAHPSLGLGPLPETHRHDIADILRESLEHEQRGVDLYRRLLRLVEGKSVALEEYARRLVEDEVRHLGEVDKMLRRPGDIQPADPEKASGMVKRTDAR
jgi:bacterioferritin